MLLTSEATDVVRNSSIIYAPGKASNAGGAAISGLEMTQNRMGIYWSGETHCLGAGRNNEEYPRQVLKCSSRLQFR